MSEHHSAKTQQQHGPAVPLHIHEAPYPRDTFAIRHLDAHSLIPSIHADLPPGLDVSIGS
jgi:hypothetical protein